MNTGANSVASSSSRTSLRSSPASARRSTDPCRLPSWARPVVVRCCWRRRTRCACSARLVREKYAENARTKARVAALKSAQLLLDRSGVRLTMGAAKERDDHELGDDR